MKNFSTFCEEKNKQDPDLEFFNKRRNGAKKLSAQAKEKGGPAILTHWHFAAKDSQYETVLNAVKMGKEKNYFVEKYKQVLQKMEKTNFSQKEFQSLSGEIEVWGEAIARLFKE